MKSLDELLGSLHLILPGLFSGPLAGSTKVCCSLWTARVRDSLLQVAYYKALRVVHPDKAALRTEDVRERLVCRYAFLALKASYDATVAV